LDATPNRFCHAFPFRLRRISYFFLQTFQSQPVASRFVVNALKQRAVTRRFKMTAPTDDSAAQAGKEPLAAWMAIEGRRVPPNKAVIPDEINELRVLGIKQRDFNAFYENRDAFDENGRRRKTTTPVDNDPGKHAAEEVLSATSRQLTLHLRPRLGQDAPTATASGANIRRPTMLPRALALRAKPGDASLPASRAMPVKQHEQASPSLSTTTLPYRPKRKDRYISEKRARRQEYTAEQNTLRQFRDDAFLDRNINNLIGGGTDQGYYCDTQDVDDDESAERSDAAAAASPTDDCLSEAVNPRLDELITNEDVVAIRETQCVRCGQTFTVPVVLPPNMKFSDFLQKLVDVGAMTQHDVDPDVVWADDASPSAHGDEAKVSEQVIEFDSICPATVSSTKTKKHSNSKGKRQVPARPLKHLELAAVTAFWDTVRLMG